MDAADLFGGPPDRADVSSTSVATDEAPKSAASLFGGETEGNALPRSLQSKVLPIQDMPDDLFGDSGGGGGRFSDGDMGGFGAPPAAPRPSGFSPSSNIQGVPETLFGEPGVTRNAGEPFGIGAPSEPPGYAVTRGGYGGGNVRAESFLPPVDSTSGRSPPPVSNDALEPPPPPRGDDAFGISPEETQPRGAAANFDAPPKDFFGEPASESVQWWGNGPPGEQSFSSAPSTVRVSRIDQVQTRPGASAMPSDQDRVVSPPLGNTSRVSPSHTFASSSLPPSRPSSPPTGNVFGAPPLAAPIGVPPANIFRASSPSVSPPNTENPFRSERPRVHALGSPPPPPAQTLDAEPRTGLDAATSTPQPWTTNPSDPPHWTTQHQQPVHARSPQMRDEPHWNNMRSRDSPPAAGLEAWSSDSGARSHSPAAAFPLTVEPNRYASEPSSGGTAPTDEIFLDSSQGAARTRVAGSSSGGAFGPPSVAMGNVSSGDPFGGSSGLGVISQANDNSGSSSGGNEVFGRKESSEMDRTSPSPPSKAPEALTGGGQTSANNDFTATVAGDPQSTWSTEQREVSDFGAPPEAPPHNVFDFGACDDDDESTPWWQTGTHEGDQIEKKEESPSVLFGNNTGDGVSEVSAAADGIFDASTDKSARRITHTLHTSGQTAVQNESTEFGAPPAAMFGAPATDDVAAADAKLLQDHDTLIAGGGQQALPRSIHEEPDKASNYPVASNPLDNHATLGVGGDAPTTAGEKHDPVDPEADPVLRKPEGEEVVKGRESPGWVKQSLPPLQLGVYEAPPGELFAGENDDPFGAPGEADELSTRGGGFEDWGMCPAAPAPVAGSGGTRAVSASENLTADAPGRNDNRNPFERKLDSLDVVAPKEKEIGPQAMTVPAEEQATEDRRDETVKHPLLGHCDGTRPEMMDAPATLPDMNSSFRVDYTSTAPIFGVASPVEPSLAPSSPTRLFASRSTSWAVRETNPESDSDFCEVFSNSGARRGGRPQRELATIHDVEQVENDESLPTLAMSAAAAPDSTVLESVSESAVDETAEESFAVKPISRIVESQQDTESGSNIYPPNSLAAPAGAGGGRSGTRAVETMGFLLEGRSTRWVPPSDGPSPVAGQGHNSGATEVAVGDVYDAKKSREGEMGDKEEERYPRWDRDTPSVAPSRTVAVVEHKVDAGRTVNVDNEWNAADDDWGGGSDDRCSSGLGVDRAKGANEKEGSKLEARKEDADDAERTLEALGEEGLRNRPEDGQDEEVGDSEGGDHQELRDGEGTEVRAEGEAEEEEDDMEDSFEISDEESENVVSVVERTACEFFSPSNSISETKPESPREIPPSESSRASLGSLSPLPEYGSVSPRQKEDGRPGISEAHRSLSSLGSSSRSSLADVPKMFPPSSIYRVRRASVGGLPPPVPSYSPASVRSTWRSLSPSRVDDFNGNGNAWSVRSPMLRDGQTAGTQGVRACSFSPTRERVPGFKAMELGPGLLSLPPSRIPQRTFGRSGESAGFARLGQTKAMPSSSEVVEAGQGRSEAETFGDTVDKTNFSDAAAIPQEQIQQPCQTVDDDPEEFSPVAEEVSSLSSAELSKSHSIPQDDDDKYSVEHASPDSEDILEVLAPSQVVTAHDVIDGTEIPACEEPPPSPPASKNPRDPVAGAGEGMRQTALPLPLPWTCLESKVGRIEEVSEADPPASGARGPRARDACEIDHNTAEDGAVGADGNDLVRVAAAPLPRPPRPNFLSSDLFGEHIGESSVASQPSHLVNKDSPLTRPRKKQSLFDNDSADGEDGGEGNKIVSSAADLFATEAPAAPADGLFAAQRPEASGATPDGAGRLFAGNMEGGNGNQDLFSQGPPPETLPLPPQSLPNPWGSSPLKQPLPEPKRRPTRGGTGFDCPSMLPPLPTDKTPGHGIATGFEDAEGGVPAAFGNLGSQRAGEGGGSFDVVSRTGAKAGGNTFRAAPASFMPPFATPGSSVAPTFAAKPRESNRSAPPLGVEVSGESVPLRTSNPFGASLRRPAAPAVVAPAVAKLGHHRVSSSFSVRSGGSGGWGSTAAAAAAGADKAQRDPNVRPPGVLAVFGFGGKLVCMYPRQKLRLAPAPGVVPPPDDGSEFRSGPVMLWSVKDLAEPGKVLRDPEAFPGPASSAPLDKLKGYVEGRATNAANEGERLLWSITGLALQFKGCLASDVVSTDANSPEASIVKLLKDASARRKEAGRDVTMTPTPMPSPLPAPMSPMTLGGAHWRPVPRPHTSNPPRDPREVSLAFPGAGAGTTQGSLLRPGHRTVGSDGGGGVGTGSAFLGGVTPPGVASSGVRPFGTSAPMDGRSVARGEGMGTGSREEVEALLVDGKKEEAVDASIRAGLWGLALLIAAQCPAPPAAEGSEGEGDAPPQPPYQRVVRLYANAFLQSGTPLHTLALAFSGQAGTAIKHGGKSLGGPMGVGVDGSLGQGGFKDTWMATAAAIVSNKVPGWREQLIGLGDRLMESDDVPAAHALFLVAGLQADLPTTKGARLVLPGVDHRKPEHRALRTGEATDAVHLLEVLDEAWKDSRGRSSAVQGHKLRLAMRLADAGFLQKAYQYVVNTQAEVLALSGRSEGGPEQRNPYSPQFISALKDFEDRVRAALDSEDAAKNGQVGVGKKERSAGSAAAGAGRWLLDGVASMVKKSATPGPIPQGPRAASGAQSNTPNSDALARELAEAQTYPPKPMLKPEPPTRVPAQPHQRPQHAFTKETAYVRKASSSSFPGAGPAPAAWPAPPQTTAHGQQPFGPRPPGLHPRGPMPSMGAEQQAHNKPQSETSSPLNAAQRDSSGDSLGDERRSVIPSSPNSFSGGRTLSPPLPEMAEVANLLGHGEENSGAVGKGMMHVSSAPALSEVLGDQTSPNVGKEAGQKADEGMDKNKSGAAAGPQRGAARGEVEQAPKSESGKGNKGKGLSRTSTPSGVGKKPGMWAKMMIRWLHPDAKFADVGKEMEAYYDEKAKRWVFPGEDPDDAAPAAPSVPPTASQLSAPGPSAPQPTPGLEANDPLAALMAPPPASFGGAKKLTTPGAAPGGGPPIVGGGPPTVGGGPPTVGGGPPTMGGGVGAGGGPPTGGLSWASKGTPPMSTWGGTRSAVKSPFPVASKFTATMPKAPSSTSSTTGEGGSVSGGGDG